MSSNLHNNILETIGRTPVVRINNLGPKNVTIYVKVESFNPMSSVKDRLALAIIEAAERSGALKPGQTVIEATSGNTGIALAMVCAVKGYPFVAVMADSFSIERRQLMRSLGAKVVLTPAAKRGSGMLEVLNELCEKHGYFNANQFATEANAAYHSNTTAAEILSDFRSERLDYFVSGWGTGGTITGTSKVLKTARPDCKIMMAEPANAAMFQGEAWNGHPIQGWAPDFKPEVMNGIEQYIDGYVKVSGDEAMATARDLACKEGIFCGTSSGATLAAALKVAETAPDGSYILAMLPDTGERYLSTALYASLRYDGSDELETTQDAQ